MVYGFLVNMAIEQFQDITILVAQQVIKNITRILFASLLRIKNISGFLFIASLLKRTDVRFQDKTLTPCKKILL